MIITRVVLNEVDLDRRVRAVARKLAPDVVRIRYDIALDSTDQEAFFPEFFCPTMPAARKGWET